MYFSRFMALRYLNVGKKNRVFSWISILTIIGVAIGVAAMICVWAVINGFEKEMRQNFLSANAHILVYRYPYGMKDIPKWEGSLKKFLGDKSTGISEFIHYETMIRHNNVMRTTLIRGISPDRREKVQSLKRLVKPNTSLKILQAEIGTPQPQVPSIIIGSGIAKDLNIKINDFIDLLKPESDLENIQMSKFKVVGVYDSGFSHYDDKIAFMSIPVAQNLFDFGKRVTGLEIGLYNPDDSIELSKTIRESFSLSVREWQTFNKPLFESMQVERVVILLITTLVALVAGLNILTIVFVSVSQKQKDISVLKSLGATKDQIMSIFLMQSFFIGVVGSLIGSVLAYIISFVIKRYKIIDLPDTYLISKLPVVFEAHIYLIVITVSLLIAIISGAIPAYKASILSPVSGINGISK